MSRNRLLSGVAAIAVGVMFSVPAAKADEMQVGLISPIVNPNVINIPTGGSSTNGSMDWLTQPYGGFETQGSSHDSFGAQTLLNPTGLPLILFSNTIDTEALTSGTLTVDVVASDQTQLKGFTTWLSQFTTGGSGVTNASVTESTYFKEGNVTLSNGESQASVLSGALLLQSKTLTGFQSTVPFANAETISTPWSVIEVYQITASAANQEFNDTISLDARVPEPASLSLLGGGLLAFGAWRRRKNSKA